MVHWLIPGTSPESGLPTGDINEAADGFDLPRFLDQFSQSGADWLIFTIGQNGGTYCSPSQTLDRLAGPGRCSRRDLILEIAQGVHAQGKRFIAYLPAEVAAQSSEIHEAFGWNTTEGTDQSEFQKRYRDFIQEYAVRLGPLLDGWWFDGVYSWPIFHNSRYDWPAWFAASRAGNPDAVVALNDGSFCTGVESPVTELQDYTSGEVEALVDGQIRFGRDGDAPLYLPQARHVPGTQCQWHALLPIDCFWAHGAFWPMEPPYYEDENLFSFMRHCRSVGGAVTLNVGIYQEGHLGERTLAQVRRLHAALSG